MQTIILKQFKRFLTCDKAQATRWRSWSVALRAIIIQTYFRLFPSGELWSLNEVNCLNKNSSFLELPTSPGLPQTRTWLLSPDSELSK